MLRAATQAVANRDLWEQRDMRAFLLTPREHFVTNPNLGRAYGSHPLGIVACSPTETDCLLGM